MKSCDTLRIRPEIHKEMLNCLFCCSNLNLADATHRNVLASLLTSRILKVLEQDNQQTGNQQLELNFSGD